MNGEVTASGGKPETLLFIDDEANILAALKRLFRPLGYTILTAESGEAALALLEKESVDLVISDMRMPHMSGAEVLEKLRHNWPDVVRILLTGYSDINTTIAAINRGEIYRYIAKPWDDNDIVLVVRDALERKRLLAEKQQLEALTSRQNDELKVLNSTLEDKVRQRTEELHVALNSLVDSHQQLKKDYFSTIQIFANLMELRKGTMAGHSRRVAQLCRDIARKLNLSEEDSLTIETAALLHDIGKIVLPDNLLDKPYLGMLPAEQADFNKHPLRAAAALMALDPLSDVAELIRHHLEHYDGVGNPSGLSGDSLPLGSRILLVASDYDALQQGLICTDKLSPEQALDIIVTGSSTRYDPGVVKVFRELIAHASNHGGIETEFLVGSAQLHEGMRLTRDIVIDNGMLLMMKDTVLNQEHIREIRALEHTIGEQLTIYTHSI